MIRQLPHYEGLNVTYNVTEDCNLRCSYCYEVDKQPVDLPLEYAKAFTRILLDDPDPIGVLGTDSEWMVKGAVVLDFIGGDPLMRVKLVEDTIRDFLFEAGKRNHRWAGRWRMSMSTNGTLFTSEAKKFLEEFRANVSVGVSVDGCPEIHDRLRSNSMAAILKEWDWYMNFAGPTASTKATLNRESIPYLSRSLRFLHETLGLKQVNMNFIFEPMGEKEDDLAELDRQMQACVEYVKLHRDDLYWGMIDSRFARATPPEPGSLGKGWCGAGAMPTLGVNGKIYPCFRFMPHTMHDRAYDISVGDVWSGISRKENFCRVRDQTRAKVSEAKCLSCDMESACAWCIGSSFSESGQFYRQTNICRVIQIQRKWAREYWRWFNGNA